MSDKPPIDHNGNCMHPEPCPFHLRVPQYQATSAEAGSKLTHPYCVDEGCPHHGTPHVCVSVEIKPQRAPSQPDTTHGMDTAELAKLGVIFEPAKESVEYKGEYSFFGGAPSQPDGEQEAADTYISLQAKDAPGQLYDLKPCPFCGSEALMGESDDGANFIECMKCKASTSLQYSLMDDGRPQLVERWNQRVDAAHRSAQDRERIAELEREVSSQNLKQIIGGKL